MSSEPVTIGTGEALVGRPKALLVRIHTPEAFGLECMDRIWIPHSQIHEDSEVWKVGHIGTVVVTLWLAEQRGWA